MITLEHLRIYQHYENSDGFSRCASKQEKLVLDDSHWRLLEELIRDAFLLEKGLLSQKYAKRATDKLQNQCDSTATINELKRISLELNNHN